MANGAEVGSGHVSIFPVMNGFRSRVQKEMQAAGKSGASQFGNAFNGAGGKIGKQLGGNLKGSFDQVTAALGESTLKKLQGDVAKSSQAYSTALIKSKDAALNVRDAEDKLAAAIAKHGEGSVQAEKAALRLESAQLKQKAASDSLAAASEKLKTSQQTLKLAQDEFAAASLKSGTSFTTMASQFAAGLSSLDRGKSTFTGLAGSLGSLVRAVSGVDLFQPIVNKAKGFASSIGQTAKSAGYAFTQGFSGTIMSGATGIYGVFNSLGVKAGTAAAKVSGAFKNVGSGITGAFGTVTTGVAGALGSLGSIASSAAAKIPGPFRNAGSLIATPFKAAGSLVGSYLGNVSTAASSVMQQLPAFAQSAASGIADHFRQGSKEASDAIDDLEKNGAGKLESLKAAAVAAAAAIGAALVGIGKQALDSYATWEQAVGGVDTLFKNASGIVQKYASEAYKTAGVSANDYMNQITSFSASLISSLGGDTQRAAELGNQAVIDMSDNANKMGTDLETIQQTYQSIARGNYAMLDNLKLGYGGTKAEMERLIADANKLREANGLAGDLSVDKFGDVVQAIHEVQTNLGITGTTAREASTTIEGSVNSMKAAWGNWLAELGKDNADMSGLTQQLVESIGTALSNVVPRIGQIAQGLVSAIPSIFDGLKSLLPQKLQDVFSSIGQIGNAIEPMLAPITAAFTAFGAGLLGPLLTDIPIIGGAFNGLGSALGALGGPIGMVVAALAALIATTPSLRDAFGEQVSALFSRFGAEMQTLKPTFDQLVASIQGMVNTIMTVVTQAMGMLIPMIGQIIQALLPLIPTVLQPIMEAMNMIMPVIGQLVSSLLPPLMNIITSFTPLIAQIIAAIGQIISTITSAVMPIIQQVMQAVSQLISTITPIIQSLQPVVQQVVQAIIGLIQALLPIIQDIINVVGNVVQTVVGFITNTFLPAFQSMVPFIQNVISSIGNIIEGIVNVIKGVVNVVSGIIHGDWNQVWEGFKQIASGAIQALGGILNGIWKAVIGAVAGAGTWLYNAGHQIIQGLIDGIGGAMGWLQSTISNLGSSVVSWAKGVLGIHSPSRVFRDQVGKWIPLGMSEGIEKTLPAARATVAKASSTLTDAADVAATGTITAKTVTETAEAKGETASAAGTQQLTAEAITMAILTALRQVGAFDLKVDLRTLAMLITPLVSAEQGKAQTLG